MNKIVKTKALVCLCGAAIALAGVSCTVDERYNADDILNSTDLSVTLFEKGLEIPLGSVDTIWVGNYVDKLVPEEVKEYLHSTEDGGYYVLVDGTYDVSDIISKLDIKSLLSEQEGFKVSDKKTVTISGIETDKLQFEGVQFGQDFQFPDFSAVLDPALPDFSESFEKKTGVIGHDIKIAADIPDQSQSITLISSSNLKSAASMAELAHLTEFNLSTLITSVPASLPDITLDAFTQPDGLKSVDAIHLVEGAGVEISVSIQNSILSSGSITPDFSVDLSDLLVLEGGNSVLDLSGLVLSAGNGFKNSQFFPITDIAAEKLFQEKTVSFSGNIVFSNDAKASTALAKAATNDLGLQISLKFVNFEVKDVHATINDILIHPEPQKYDFKMEPIKLPEEVKTVNDIVFTDNSTLEIKLEIDGLESFTELDILLDEFTVVFPEALTLSGEGVNGNTFTIPSGTSLKTVLDRTVKVERLDLSAPVNGEVSFDAELSIDFKARATGSASSLAIHNLTEDVVIKGSVTSTFGLKDIEFSLNELTYDIDVEDGTVEITNLDPSVGEFGTLTVTPELTNGNYPEILISFDVPDLGAMPLDLGDGIVFNLPDIIRFGEVDPALNFNAENNSITLKTLSSAEYKMPVTGLEITPRLADDGTYYVRSSYSVEGGIRLSEAPVHLADIQKLSAQDVVIDITVPTIKAKTVALEAFNIEIPETKYEFGDILDIKDIPDMIKKITDIDLGDLALSLNVKISNLPDFGTSKFIANIKADVPDFIVLDSPLDEHIELGSDGVISLKKDIALDLSGFDFDLMRAEGKGITGEVVVSGNFTSDHPSVDVTTISADDILVEYSVELADSKGQINLNKVAAKVDYQIDTTMKVYLPLDQLPEVIKDAKIEFPVVNFLADITTNTAIPLSLSADFTPEKDDVLYSEYMQHAELRVPYTLDYTQTQTTENVIPLNLNDIFDMRADSLLFSLNGHIESERDCVIYPAADYTVSMDYQVSLPLAFGQNTDLHLSQSISVNGLEKALEYISAIGIHAEIENTLPFGIKVSAKLLKEEDGEKVELALKQPALFELKPGDTTLADVVLSLESAEQASEISEIFFDFEVVANGAAIKPGNYLLFKKISVMLPEGVNIDPLELLK